VAVWPVVEQHQNQNGLGLAVVAAAGLAAVVASSSGGRDRSSAAGGRGGDGASGSSSTATSHQPSSLSFRDSVGGDGGGGGGTGRMVFGVASKSKLDNGSSGGAHADFLMASNLQAIRNSKWVMSVVWKSAEELSPVVSSKLDAETVKTHEQQHWATVLQSVVTWCLPMSDDGSAPWHDTSSKVACNGSKWNNQRC
jgi:hypothetical protein